MCFIFHSTETVNIHNFLEPFFFREREVLSESSLFGYGADCCPGCGPSSVMSDTHACLQHLVTYYYCYYLLYGCFIISHTSIVERDPLPQHR